MLLTRCARLPPVRCWSFSRPGALLWTTAKIRTSFVDYFASRGHTPVPSASLVPAASDQSLLFTNAGMVPFKQHFLDPLSAPHPRIVTVQRCMRAGGKHNDLDNVGFTPRHHTYFEMLGNFAFGRGAQKAEAIRDAWAFLTQVVHLPVDRLRVSVLYSDTESFDIWHRDIGLPASRIDRLDETDNFWAMGDDEGPCGPCTEIFWDTGRNLDSPDRWLEIWNLVFMQYHRTATGDLVQLPMLCIDTGMGLERLASVLQGKTSNFDIDSFQTILQGIDTLVPASSTPTHSTRAYKQIIADHLRSSSFLVYDGVLPSNVGRGYVLRRILRRAIRAGHQLGLLSPFFSRLQPHFLESLDGSAPNIVSRAPGIAEVLHREELLFHQTLDRGLQMLYRTFRGSKASSTRAIDAATAFYLYDTHGFPVDLTETIAKEHGWTVDMVGFAQLQTQHRERNKASWKPKQRSVRDYLQPWQSSVVTTPFSGYTLPHQDPITSRIIAAQPLMANQWALALDPCPFYGWGGGQLPDKGQVTTCDGATWSVMDVLALNPATLAVVVECTGATPGLTSKPSGSLDAPFAQGALVTCTVDRMYRQGLTVHHTATHLLNAALHRVLGHPVVQAGSLVSSTRLRFDFSSDPLTREQQRKIERLVNETALKALPVHTTVLPLTDAQSQGAVATFGEKYQDVVRMVSISGFSKELCGGTHVSNTHWVYPFHILSEGSVAAGTRRMEAVAGPAAVAWLETQTNTLSDITQLTRAPSTAQTTAAVQALVQKTSQLTRQVRALSNQLVNAASHPVATTHTQNQPPHHSPLSIHFHTLDADLSSDCLAKRATFLSGCQRGAVHIVLQETRMAVGYHPLHDENPPRIHAGQVR
ncbi:hypothetical protein H4R34_001014 [Dimargaris verticillata]|uniref:Alanine--tRNA ligase n=1 Tax=Dimargaris verticillata TaxID=2761393 RepID=A0A9W8BBK9_9FUNG|nr:hypothetical protein H4R34_001014 [Dimargaris verticillata]